MQCHKNLSRVICAYLSEQTDGRTDSYDDANSRFSQKNCKTIRKVIDHMLV
jgi:hypothetical protein